MRRRSIAIIFAVILAIAFVFFAPVIPSRLRETSQPAAGPPQPWYTSDPDGTYSGDTFSNGTSMTSLTTYNRLLHDPYQRLCQNSGVTVEGSNVLFTCISPDVTTMPPPPNALASIAYLLTGHGGFLFNGGYLVR